MEGPELSSAMEKTWRCLAASESRLHLMSELTKLKVGFAEVEEFYLDLSSKYRSKKFQETDNEINNSKVVKDAMQLKLMDEKFYNDEIKSEQNKLRRILGDEVGKNTQRPTDLL